METGFVTIMGAPGNTGRKITEGLLKAGDKVRALGRLQNKLAELKNAGAEVFSGDTNDAAFFGESFSWCRCRLHAASDRSARIRLPCRVSSTR